MGRIAVWLLPGLALLAGGAGCAHSGKQCRCETTAHARPALALPPAHRVNLEPFFLGLPVPPPPPVAGEPPPPYKALTARECQCRAAQVSSLGNMLDAEADEVARQGERTLRACLGHPDRQAELTADLLHGSAAEARNASAGAALLLFYRLAEAEALADLQEESVDVVNEALGKARELEQRGLQGKADAEGLRRQLNELLTDRLRLQMTIDDLNTELARLLDLEISSCTCKGRVWPVFELHFCPQPPDCLAAVAEGMAKRPELYVLRRLEEEMTVENLPLIRKVLQSVNPLLGLAGSGGPLQHLAKLVALLCQSGSQEEELEARRRQVAEHRQGRERSITLDITATVRNLCRQPQLAALARERARSWQERADDLRGKFARGGATFLDITDARLQGLKARGDTIKEVMAWERFLVQLHLHQGVLIEQCREGGCAPAGGPPPAAPVQPPEVPGQPPFSTRLGRELSGAHGPGEGSLPRLGGTP
jgi:hypothetical protein